jgi:hypothetical protein
MVDDDPQVCLAMLAWLERCGFKGRRAPTANAVRDSSPCAYPGVVINLSMTMLGGASKG